MVRSIISASQKQAIIILTIGIAYWKSIEYFHWAIPCPFRLITNIPCPGCGIGRACSHLLHGHFVEALQMHFGVYLLVFYLSIALLPESAHEQLDKKIPKQLRRGLGILVLLALLLRWAMVLLGEIVV